MTTPQLTEAQQELLEEYREVRDAYFEARRAWIAAARPSEDEIEREDAKLELERREALRRMRGDA
jgi:ABC-type transporter lipoprotein component MlaA